MGFVIGFIFHERSEMFRLGSSLYLVFLLDVLPSNVSSQHQSKCVSEGTVYNYAWSTLEVNQGESKDWKEYLKVRYPIMSTM